jgi:hypothetical protein
MKGCNRSRLMYRHGLLGCRVHRRRRRRRPPRRLLRRLHPDDNARFTALPDRHQQILAQ